MTTTRFICTVILITVEPLLSGHPRDFENWPLDRGWRFIEIIWDFKKWSLNGGWPLKRWPLNRGSTVLTISTSCVHNKL